MNKKEWLDYLFYKIGRQQYDFLVCGINGDIATKWKKYSEVIMPIDPWETWKIKYINQRQILPNEIVLDIEEKERIEEIKSKLIRLGNPFYIFSTGSRGFHIHLFFNRALTEKEKYEVVEYIGADLHKTVAKTMIALEYCQHWKSGKIKELVYEH